MLNSGLNIVQDTKILQQAFGSSYRAILLRFVRRGLLRCGVCHAAIWRVMSLRPPMDVMRDRDATYVIGYESSDDF